MPSDLPASQIVAKRLTDELADLSNFRRLLAEEQQVLQSGEADRLPEINQDKIVLSESLSATMRLREQALQHLGFAVGRPGMQSWLDSLSDAERGKYGAAWEMLLALAEECRTEHAINGKLIAIRIAHNQQALTALLSASNRPLTYGPDGQQRLGTGAGRTLGSA